MCVDESISIILPIHNQEILTPHVLRGIVDNISADVKEMIIIFDGCTDGTEAEAQAVIPSFKIPVITLHTPDINEVKVNNVGLKTATTSYSILIQDDMIIKEKDFDRRMMKPFQVVPDLMAVSARDAVDARITNGEIDYYNVSGKDANTARDVFAIRDAINRGPILINNAIVKEMGYLDEEFAPIDSDDVDLCFRAYRRGYIVGSYVIDYDSLMYWGKTRTNPISNSIWEQSMIKNHKKLVARHRDLIEAPKHSRNVVIP